LAIEIPAPFLKGSVSMVTVILIGITIERWARFLKVYVDHEIEKKITNQKNP